MGSTQLFALLSGAGIGSCTGANCWPKSCASNSCAPPAHGCGLGDCSFVGDIEPLGSGMFAGTMVSPSFSLASSYCGLVPLECDGLAEGLSKLFCCRYGWCRYHPPAACWFLHAGGDQGSSELDSTSASESSNLKPECCEGIPSTGERLSMLSSDADSEGWESNILSRELMRFVAIGGRWGTVNPGSFNSDAVRSL